MRQLQGQRQPVRALAFTPDSKHLVAGDGKRMVAVYAAPGNFAHHLAANHGRADHFAFLPDGRMIAAAGDEMSVYINPTRDGAQVGFYPNEVEAPVTSLSASVDGSWLFATATHLHAWRMTERVPQRGWVVRRDRGQFWAAAVDPTGERLAVAFASGRTTPELFLHDARTGEPISVLVPGYSLRAGPLAWLPDGTGLAAIAHTFLSLFGTSDGKRRWRREAGGSRAFTSLAFHPSGRSVLVGCYDGTARLYDTANGQEIRSFVWQVGKVLSVTFSPDGCLAAAGGEKGQVIVWDVDP